MHLKNVHRETKLSTTRGSVKTARKQVHGFCLLSRAADVLFADCIDFLYPHPLIQHHRRRREMFE